MSTNQITDDTKCSRCPNLWDGEADGWTAVFLGPLDGTKTAAGILCPDCLTEEEQMKAATFTASIDPENSTVAPGGRLLALPNLKRPENRKWYERQ